MGRGKRTEKKKGNVVGKIFVTLLILAIIVAGVVFGTKILKDRQNSGSQETANGNVEPPVEEKKIQIVDEDSTSRPYAIMINNNHAAWPQCGLQDAYLVYEIIVEGGITRMMALYKDADTAKIGSIRSARHYFIDYAEENDAIYIHWGGSDAAYSRINSGINDLDGMALEGTAFFRDTSLNRDYEHTGFTSISRLNTATTNKGYRTTTNKDLLLQYSADEIDLSTIEGVEPAIDITLKYSDYHTTSYEYDEETKTYKRSMSGKANVDLETGEQYTTKNIIVYTVYNYSMDSYGRQELSNIGSGEGYYITNGYAVPITWEKTSHSGQTVYSYEDGTEITVNDGNTFIQICPTNADIDIEGAETTTIETEN